MRLLLVAALAVLPGYGDPQLLGRLPLEEVSGLAPASTGSSLLVEQDSGNGPRLQRVDRTGRLLATYRLDARNRDWEDLAVARDAQGRPSVFLADTGDNDEQRDEVQVLRLPEPPPGSTRAGPVTTSSFRYPDGPHDAEAMLVLPGGRQVALVTKTLGTAGVYVGPLGAPGVQVLRRVAEVPLRPTGTAGGPVGAFGQVLVTGGAVSPDGTRLALRTYTDLYEWALDGDLAEVLSRPGTRSPLPATAQGEAVAYERDGRGVLVASEGDDAPLHRLARVAASPSPTAPTPAAAARPQQPRDLRPWLAGAGVGAVLLAAGVLGRRRRGE